MPVWLHPCPIELACSNDLNPCPSRVSQYQVRKCKPDSDTRPHRCFTQNERMSFSATTDAHIVELLRSPRTAEQGLRLLMAKYQERLYWLIRQMVGNHEDANDVLQEVLLKVYRHAASFEGRSGLYTWLYRIAANEALGFLRKQKRRQSYSMDDEANGLANRLHADGWFDEEAAQRALWEAIDRLPDKQRQVFQMRYFDEMSYREMSELLGTSVGALKASFHHAAKKVEAYLRATQTL